MATKFVQEQQRLESEYTHRGRVFASGHTFAYGNGRGLRGKAAKKAQKRATHQRRYYAAMRSA